MKKSHSTKKALLASIVSLCLCIAMLAGTTFAWFTDSVSSENNIITAGNLDIELYWSTNAENWTKVDGNTNIFKDDALWEPGYTEVVYLKVVNEGSLALKYWLGVNVVSETTGANQQGKFLRLSDYIQFGVVKTGDDTFKSKYETREEALAAIDADDYKAISAGYSNSSKLWPETNAEGLATEEYATLVVTMPESVGDEANHNGVIIPSINIGLNVFATQLSYEKDSYGSDYDIGTPWAGEIDISWYNTNDTAFVLTTPQQLAGLAEIVNSGADTFSGKLITLGADIDLNNIEWTPIGRYGEHSKDYRYVFAGTFDGGDDYTVSNLLITGVKNYVGLFGYTRNNKGEIKNLTVENAKVSGHQRVGTVVGQAYDTKMTNITVTGHVEINGVNYVGGVVGRGGASNDWADITVNVDAKSYVKADATKYIPGNSNADENGYVHEYEYVGGVLGHMESGARIRKNITSNIDVYGYNHYIGGAFGIVQYDEILENIIVTGDVIGIGETTHIGGIAGGWQTKANKPNNIEHFLAFTNCDYQDDDNSSDITEDIELFGGYYKNLSNDNALIIDGKDPDGNWAGISATYLANALKQNGSVKIYSNLSGIQTPLSQQPLQIPEGVVVDLDLNGMTISAKMSNNMLINDGTLTVKNGSITNTQANAKANIVNNGTMTLENVTVKCGIYSQNGANYPKYAIENYGKLTAEAGISITAYGGGIYTAGATAETEINGATISISKDKAQNWKVGRNTTVHVYAVYATAGSKVTINGGDFAMGGFASNSTTYTYGVIGAANGADLSVTGGTFNADPSNINGANYVAADHQAVDNGNGTYTVFAKMPGVEISKDPASGLIWNGNDANNQSVYYIYSAADLQKAASYFAGQTNSPEGDRPTFELMNDIDMAGIAWTPWDVQFIYFNGNDHTISNLTVNGDSSWNGVSGLFGYLGGCTVKDLTLKNVTSTGSMAGTFAGQTEGSDLINCTLEGENVVAWSKPTADATVGDGIGAFVGVTVESSSDYTCTIADGATVTLQYNGMLNSANVNANLNAYVGGLYTNCTPTLNITNNGKLVFAVATTAELISAIKSAPVGSVTEIELADGTYNGDIDITVAALGKSGGDVVIKAAEGAEPVITGTVTLGYREQGTGATMYDANVTFEGITFNHADSTLFSIEVGDVKSLDLINCTIIGAGETGIHAARGNATGPSKITGCTFINAAIQGYGNYCTGMVIEGCIFTNSCINIQAGNGVTVQNCSFNNTLTDANNNESFYVIRSNSTPITVTGCTINIDSTVAGIGTPSSKGWGVFVNRGTTNWTVSDVQITLTEAAQTQTALEIAKCTSTGAINMTNVTVNGEVQ